MNKILKAFSTIVIALFILSLFGWMVKEMSTKNKKFGFITEPVKFMYNFPDLFEQSVEEVQTLPKTFIPTPADFQSVNKLDKDLLVLSSFSDTNESRSVVLLNLKNDSILRKWTFPHPTKKAWIENERIVNPILYPDGSLLYNFYYTRFPGLQMLDPSGNLVWKSDSLIVHHGMNLNKDGDIWASTKVPFWMIPGKYFTGGMEVLYSDYTITKYDKNTGDILFHKSITEILNENGLSNYILKTVDVKDPIHLNDVQPALKTTKHYKEDDVFISLRNIHLILHYRPSTNELINKIEGPFVHQHDVDILDDNTIVIFNNNTAVGINRNGNAAPKKSIGTQFAGDFYSNIVSYNFETESFAFVGDSIFRANKIFTLNEGLAEFLDPDTYFVEEQNSGLLWVIRNDEVIYKNVFKSQHEGHHHLPNWTRIINYE